MVYALECTAGMKPEYLNQVGVVREEWGVEVRFIFRTTVTRVTEGD